MTSYHRNLVNRLEELKAPHGGAGPDTETHSEWAVAIEQATAGGSDGCELDWKLSSDASDEPS